MRLLSQRSAALLIQAAGWPLLGLLGAARLGTWRHNWLLDLVDTWASYPLAGWPLLGLIALRTRSAGLAALSAAGGALAADSAHRVVGRNAGRPATGRVLRVLTANVLGRNPSPGGLIELIERERPDLVMLQEIRSAFGEELLARVGHLLPEHQVCPHPRFGGAALLSRWPLEGAERFLLRGCGHLCQRARVCVGGQALAIFNIHLETPYEIHQRAVFPPFQIRRRARHARDRQVEELIEMVEAADGPVLVAGDFNTSAGSRPHRVLLRHLRDAYLEAGRGVGHTFPQPAAIRGLWLPAPLLRIDYVYFRGGLEPLRARTLPHRGSDHRALLVEFSLAESKGRRLLVDRRREAAG